MIFFTKIKFYPKQLQYLIIHAMHSKEHVKLYTLISIFIFIDTYLGGNIAQLVFFLEFLEDLIIFWKLNFQISRKLQIEFKELFYIIIEGAKALSMHIHLNFIPPLELTKVE